tara:strand:+ start:2066 stop:2230 length:165 start_codon:yes stop_codon:yes gene_type:complete
MELTNEEKQLILGILKQHLEEVDNNEKLPDQSLAMLSAEVKYSDFIQNIINKLS